MNEPDPTPAPIAPGRMAEFWGTKIPGTVAFGIAILLFFMPFIDIKCNSITLQKVSGVDLDIRTETLSMQVGENVILAYGQLAGMEGTIVSRLSKHEVKVALESLGLQMVIQVEANMLERAWG